MPGNPFQMMPPQMGADPNVGAMPPQPQLPPFMPDAGMGAMSEQDMAMGLPMPPKPPQFPPPQQPPGGPGAISDMDAQMMQQMPGALSDMDLQMLMRALQGR